MSALWSLVKRDLLIAAREGGATGTALGFYLIVIALMPLGLGPDLQLLSRIAPGVLWIGLLLAALLSLGRIFETDKEEGVLEILATGRVPLEFVVAAKAFAHWLSSCVPLAILSPLLGLLLNLELAAYPILLGTILIGSPAISFLGSIGAALTLRSRRGGLLIALLVLPLYIPTLIFGISAISAVVTPPGSLEASLLLLSAVTIASLVIGPIAAAAALRAQLG
ncbi:MAG: heme exporter protein CcmB [Proteobacteria bacterium]|jgi:heme exporter protein CcmB|nr:MAG: heme exporter protein CcmB [Pseudomonadota bacterium]